jgi:hypothetical protein
MIYTREAKKEKKLKKNNIRKEGKKGAELVRKITSNVSNYIQ